MYLSYELRQALITHCTKEFPYEACGLLSGRYGIAQTCWPMVNQDKSEYSFSMAISDIEKVFQKIEDQNEEVMAIYHSHPSSEAYPSPGDIAMNNYPDLIHIIVSLKNHHPDMRAFLLEGTQVTELDLYLS